MASWTEIANLTLTMAGEATILDLSESNHPAPMLLAVRDTVRDTVLAAHPWNFAIHRAQRAATGTAPVMEWSQTVTLPTDPYCLKVLDVWSGAVKLRPGIEYAVEGRSLLADQAPLRIRYIKRVTDPAAFSPGFVQALAAYWAHTVAYRLTESRSKEAELLEKYAGLLRHAASIDGQESPPVVADDSEWLAARFGGGWR